MAVESESTDDYETTNGDDDLEKSITDDDDSSTVVCSKCTLKNKVKKFNWLLPGSLATAQKLDQ